MNRYIIYVKGKRTNNQPPNGFDTYEEAHGYALNTLNLRPVEFTIKNW